MKEINMTQQELNNYRKGSDWVEMVMPWIYCLVIGALIGTAFIGLIMTQGTY